MHKSFFPLFAITFIIIIIATFFSSGNAHFIPILCGLLPIAIYHSILLRKKEPPLTPNEVDSIYYFGFLVTIVILVTTAISMGLKNDSKPDLKAIMLQFGFGLAATGYALFARLQLLTKLNSFSEADILTSTKNLSDRIDSITSELTRAQYQITGFIDLSELSFNQVKGNFDNSCSSILTSTSSTIKESTQQFSEAISSVMEEIGRIQTEAESISFSLASGKIALFSSELNISMKKIADTATKIGDETNEAITQLTKAARKMLKLASQITDSAESLQSLDNLVNMASNIVVALDLMSQSAVASEKALSSMEASIKQASTSISDKIIHPVNSSTIHDVLKEVTTSFAEMRSTTEAMTLSFSSVAMPLKNQMNIFHERLQSLSDTINNLNGAIISNDIVPGLISAKEKIQNFEIKIGQDEGLLTNRVSEMLRSITLDQQANDS
ncbi:MAG: hypothetical protein Q7U10_11300 [Thermodesulfovibrionia bacterium]|nr:hypothetical protein [Thermodesulfovibrionia bacterium]